MRRIVRAVFGYQIKQKCSDWINRVLAKAGDGGIVGTLTAKNSE
jgi:hypothetical protein